MTKLRVGVIGAGHLGRIHTRLLKTLDHVHLVGVADPFPTARESITREFEVPCFADYMELVGQVDAVVIAAPTTLHYDIARTMLMRGIHCLVEKPITPTSQEADELVALAQRHGATLQVGHVERFNPAWNAALPHLRDTRVIECTRSSGFTGRSTDVGVVLDLMIHDLDLVLSLIDSPLEHVEAFGISLLTPHEDSAEARLYFANGALATLKASRVSPKPTRALQAITNEGSVLVDFTTPSAQVIQPCEEILSHRFRLEQLTAEQRAQIKDQVFTHWMPLTQLEIPTANAILEEQKDFVSAVTSGHQPRVTGEQGAYTLHVAEKILDAIAQHAWFGASSKPHQIGPTAVPVSPVIPARHLFPDRTATPPLRKAG